MNILTIESCGHITAEDPFLFVMQGVSTEHAEQFVRQLVMATRSDCVARFIGLDLSTGEMLDPKYAYWLTPYEGVRADLEARATEALAKQGEQNA